MLLALKCNILIKFPEALNSIHPPIKRHRNEVGGVDKILDMICGILTKNILYTVTKSQQSIKSTWLQRDQAYIF